MTDNTWMLYGATGYTGRLLVEEAVKRGHRPLLAGRSAARLDELKAEYDLPAVAFELTNAEAIANVLRNNNVSLVLHAAGPFIETAEAMRRACIMAGAHYLDITGEIDVYEASFSADESARAASVLVMSGVGMDIVPSDCQAKYVSEQFPEADTLEMTVSTTTHDSQEVGASAGTIKSVMRMIAGGSVVRRGGQLIQADFAGELKTVELPDGKHQAVSIPWGDVSTAYRTTGIPNITLYMTLPSPMASVVHRLGVTIQWLMGIKPVRDWLGVQVDQRISGPSAQARRTGRTVIYARASNRQGHSFESWLETIESYAFTARSALLAVEKALTGEHSGALTPAQAFGADFALEIEGTYRFQSLNDYA